MTEAPRCKFGEMKAEWQERRNPECKVGERRCKVSINTVSTVIIVVVIVVVVVIVIVIVIVIV